MGVQKYSFTLHFCFSEYNQYHMKKVTVTTKAKKSGANPFDGEHIKGRVFSKKEVEERRKFFSKLFNVPYVSR